jgi:hypothetical protein
MHLTKFIQTTNPPFLLQPSLNCQCLLMLCRCEASDQSKIFVLHIGVFTEASADVPV